MRVDADYRFVDLVQPLDFKDLLAPANVIVVELVPVCQRREFWPGECSKRAEVEPLCTACKETNEPSASEDRCGGAEREIGEPGHGNADSVREERMQTRAWNRSRRARFL